MTFAYHCGLTVGTIRVVPLDENFLLIYMKQNNNNNNNSLMLKPCSLQWKLIDSLNNNLSYFPRYKNARCPTHFLTSKEGQPLDNYKGHDAVLFFIRRFHY